MNANSRPSCDHHAEEDYIYMEVGSVPTIFSHHFSKTSSSPIAREFEFQMSTSLEKDSAPSPADELFYKGKLLPLLLPPRLQMVEKLLQNANINNYYESKKFEDSSIFDESFSTPLFTNTNNTPTANNTPFESCNISPSESCQVSRELNPEEYYNLFEYSTEASNLLSDQNPKISWTKKFNLIKQLKSFLSKSSCTNETSAAAAATSRSFPRANERVNKYIKAAKKSPFGQIQNGGKKVSRSSNFDKELLGKNEIGGSGRHRRSFSGAIKKISVARSSSFLTSSSGSSSASSSTNSNGSRELQFFKGSNSLNSDIESPIQAAIAHCKRSQQLFNSRKTVSELGFCSLSSARVISEDQRPGICRG